MFISRNVFGLCIVISVGIIFDFVKAVPEWRASVKYGGYLIEKDQKFNWFEASHICASRNMQLVEILSKEKNDDLIQVLKAFLGVSTNLWLGAIDQFSTAKDFKRSFYWQSGKSMVYHNWSVENPNNAASNEHCSHIWATKANFEWNDNVCTAKMGFICERQTCMPPIINN